MCIGCCGARAVGEPDVIELDAAGTFRVLSDGDHVVCAVTGERIPLHDLRYWSVERQEPYVDAAASLKAEQGPGRR